MARPGLPRTPGKWFWSHLPDCIKQCLKPPTQGWGTWKSAAKRSRSSSTRDSFLFFFLAPQRLSSERICGFLNNFLNIGSQNIYRTTASCIAVFLPAPKFFGYKAKLKGALVLPQVKASCPRKKQNSDFKTSLGAPRGSTWPAETDRQTTHLCVSGPWLHAQSYNGGWWRLNVQMSLFPESCPTDKVVTLTMSVSSCCNVWSCGTTRPTLASGPGTQWVWAAKLFSKGPAWCWLWLFPQSSLPKHSVLSHNQHWGNPTSILFCYFMSVEGLGR